uniref:Uncharacterized protein n=1 Tax=Arundo donax TaxID=35708 RepID=A0A0A8ZCW8_ARUDO
MLSSPIKLSFQWSLPFKLPHMGFIFQSMFPCLYFIFFLGD